MEKLIKYGNARVLKHRIKKQKIVGYKSFKILCESGHISKNEATEIAEKSINEIRNIINSISNNDQKGVS